MTARPFLKYAGGKRKLAERIIALMPTEVNRYVEPCVGAGAVFIAMAERGLFKSAVIADINPWIANLWKWVRDDVDTVIAMAAQWANTPEQYAWVRNERNARERTLRREVTSGIRTRHFLRMTQGDAAMELWLNRHCFSGLHRENAKGEFNVGFGKCKSPKIDAENLRAVSALLKGVEVRCEDVATMMHVANDSPHAFYIDPPYDGGFVGYSAGGFTADDQRRLAEAFHGLKFDDGFAILSNADTPLIRELYDDPRQATVHEIMVPRPINSDGSGRSAVAELIIVNTPVIGTKVRVVRAIDDECDDGHIGKSGVIVGPDLGMALVEFSDGVQGSFWAEELEVIGSA